ncbi:NUMOD4 [uncultured Caudovirales phage]|uniref:NUMOD4 n=1 Tax=uncultured Caudovirales phage TaxID=2100421 RepID=A0A6J5KHA2_9CAUD|nr:NUMOD4 [uncultured Caudovirales phage]
MPTNPDLAALSEAATERWAPIAGWEGVYEVSDHGRVRSLARDFGDKAGRRRPTSGRIIKQRTNKEGYVLTCLSAFGRPRKTITVHRLVAGAFIPNPDSLPFVNHKNSDRTCNIHTNLEWCTHAENVAHAKQAGRLTGRPPMYRSDKRALSDDQVREVRRLFASGVAERRLAAQFKVGPTAISGIVRGRSYRDVLPADAAIAAILGEGV